MGNPPLPNSVTAAVWREAVMAQQPYNFSSSITSQHEAQHSGSIPTSAAGPFLLMPPSSAGTNFDVRCGKPQTVQTWEDGSRGSSTPSTALQLNLPPSGLQPQASQPLHHMPHSMWEYMHNPALPLKRLKLFSLNDYLGLSAHPDVAAAAAAAVSMVRALRCSRVFCFCYVFKCQQSLCPGLLANHNMHMFT
eukprot:scaffold180541_cov15-Tisochrysis_lutea.AAC.4